MNKQGAPISKYPFSVFSFNLFANHIEKNVGKVSFFLYFKCTIFVAYDTLIMMNKEKINQNLNK